MGSSSKRKQEAAEKQRKWSISDFSVEIRPIFNGYSKKLRQLLMRKYEALSHFMKESNGDTFFADTDGSGTIYEILGNNDISMQGK